MTPRLHAAVLFLSLAATLPQARADIYMYTDDDGGVHLSNVPTEDRYERIVADVVADVEAKTRDIKGSRSTVDKRFAAVVASVAAQHGLPEALLHAVIKAESNYNPDAVSRKGAVGLMQLMPGTAQRYGVSDRRDPAQNIAGGARYLRDLLARFGEDLRIALAAYNAGPGAVARSGNAVPAFAETRRYVPRVLELYRQFASAQPQS